MNTLGKHMMVYSVTLRGKRDRKVWESLGEEIAREIGMSPVAPPAIWEYPVDGQGGNGITVVQPITESFIALDVWPDHNGAYLIICSCRTFFTRALTRFLWRLEFEVGEGGERHMELNHD